MVRRRSGFDSSPALPRSSTDRDHGPERTARRCAELHDRARPHAGSSALRAALRGRRRVGPRCAPRLPQRRRGLLPRPRTDLRAPESQPVAAFHAFEVLGDVAPVTAPEAVELCDWLRIRRAPRRWAPVRAADRGPERLRAVLGRGDPEVFSQITTIVVAHAARVASTIRRSRGTLGRRSDPVLPGRARRARRADAAERHELAFAVRFLDAVHDREERARGCSPVGGLRRATGGSA